MNPTRALRSAAVASVAMALIGCHNAGPQPEAVVSREEKLLVDLSVLASGKPADDAKAQADALRSGALTVDGAVDALLKKPMGGRLAKDIVLGASSPVKDRHPLPVHSVLSSTKDGDDARIFYLRNPCDRADAVKVHAWWGDDVLVCADSYRPTVLNDGNGRNCGGTMLAPRDVDVCGCGPALMYCSRDKFQFEATTDSFQREVVDTAGYVVDGDLPIEQLFTMNETVRTDIAEFMYRRARVAAGEKVELLDADFGKKPKLAPRVEQVKGQHAGILSTPSMTYASDALRGVMRNIYDYLWCTGVQSARVSTESILALKVVDLRVGDGWRDLAAMNVCTDCHARLDYGMQFFAGYPSSTAGVDFRPSDVKAGKGPLYGRDIKDERGTDDLTPAGFARLATAQPEFGDCMSRRVVDHVFNGTEESADFEAVRSTFEQTHTIKGMLKTAMVRYATRTLHKDGKKAEDDPAQQSASTVVAGTSGDRVQVSPRLHTLLQESCKECHKAGKDVDVTAAELDRSLLLRMIDQVAFGAMPKNAEGLDDGQRRALIEELARHAYANADDRKVATAWFLDGVRGRPVHRFASAMNVVNARVGKGEKGFRPGAIELATAQSFISYSPSIAVSEAVTAMRSCDDAGHTGDALADCVARASAPSAVLLGRLAD